MLVTALNDSFGFLNALSVMSCVCIHVCMPHLHRQEGLTGLHSMISNSDSPISASQVVGLWVLPPATLTSYSFRVNVALRTPNLLLL